MHKWWQDTICLVGISTFSVLHVASKLKFNFSNLKLPMSFFGDELQYANEVHSLMQFHSLLNSTFGAPFGQDLRYAFISSDLGPIVGSAILGSPWHNVFLGLNLFYLLSYALVSSSMYLTTRALGANRLFSTLSSFCVSVSLIHFQYNPMGISGDAYFLMPIIIAVVALQLIERNSRPQIIASKRRFRVWLIFCFLYGTFYSYYTIGTFLVLGSTAIVWAIIKTDFKNLKNALSTAIAVGLGFLVSMMPNLWAVAHIKGTVNYIAQRDPWATFPDSSVFFQHIAPVNNTLTYNLLNYLYPKWTRNIDLMHSGIQNSSLFGEGAYGNIDLAALILGIVLVYFVRRHHVHNLIEDKTKQLSVFLFTLVLMSFFWSEAEGPGTFVGVFFTSILRAYARMIIFALVALFILIAIAATALIKKSNNDWRKIYIVVVVALFLAVGDSYTLTWPSITDKPKTELAQYRQVVSKLPQNCSVLQFPVIHFYWENPGYPAYDLLRPGLVGTRSDLHWSSGAIGGSSSWVKQDSVFSNFQNRKSMGLELAAKKAGYCAIYVDSKVWDTFHSFKPWPSYLDSPAIGISDFLASMKKYEVYELTDRKIYIEVI